MLFSGYGLGRVACGRRLTHVNRGVLASIRQWNHVLVNPDSKRVARPGMVG
jgi:hypothetical protein